jgi:hypothetical protein
MPLTRNKSRADHRLTSLAPFVDPPTAPSHGSRVNVGHIVLQSSYAIKAHMRSMHAHGPTGENTCRDWKEIETAGSAQTRRAQGLTTHAASQQRHRNPELKSAGRMPRQGPAKAGACAAKLLRTGPPL